MAHLIYKITTPSQKVYIGKTSNLIARISYYKNLRCKSQTLLYNSIKKYGWINLKFEILENVVAAEASAKEQYYIKLYDTYKTKHGLNLTSGGDGSIGLQLSEAHKKAIIKSNKSRVVSANTRIKMSLAKKGIIPINAINAARIKNKGNKYNLGIVQTQQQKDKRANTYLKNMLLKKGPILQLDNNKEVIKKWEVLYKDLAKILCVNIKSLKKAIKSKGTILLKDSYWIQ